MARLVVANIVMTLDGRTSGTSGAGDMSVIAPNGVSEQARDALVRMPEAGEVRRCSIPRRRHRHGPSLQSRGPIAARSNSWQTAATSHDDNSARRGTCGGAAR